jgi:hypothetical protein
MARDGRLDQLRPPLAQALKGARLILFHEAAIADDIGGKNGGEPPFHICTRR